MSATVWTQSAALLERVRQELAEDEFRVGSTLSFTAKGGSPMRLKVKEVKRKTDQVEYHGVVVGKKSESKALSILTLYPSGKYQAFLLTYGIKAGSYPKRINIVAQSVKGS